MRVSSLLFCLFLILSTMAQKTQKPPLHGKNWMAITGKPLAANAGAMIFHKVAMLLMQPVQCLLLPVPCGMY